MTTTYIKSLKFRFDNTLISEYGTNNNVMDIDDNKSRHALHNIHSIFL